MLAVRGYVTPDSALAAGRWLPVVDADESESEEPVPLVGLGDFDGNTPDYYDQGAFFNGRLRLRGDVTEWMTADLQLTCTHVAESGIETDHVTVALAFDPCSEPPVLNDSGSHEVFGHAWSDYVELLTELAEDRYRVLPVREAPYTKPDPDHVTVFLRHDTDLTMYGALQMARAERAFGISTTYHINMMSSIYGLVSKEGDYVVNPRALENLRELQDMGHEVGLHNDSVIARVLYGVPLRSFLHREVGRLRRHGLDVRTESENGSPYAYDLKTENRYAFLDYGDGGQFSEIAANTERTNGFNGVVVVEEGDHGLAREVPLPRVSLDELGLIASATLIQHYIEGSSENGYRENSDVGGGIEMLIPFLRERTPGESMQLITHCNRWTTHCEELEFAGDDFSRYAESSVPVYDESRTATIDAERR